MAELIGAIALMYLTVMAAGLWLRGQGRRDQEGGES